MSSKVLKVQLTKLELYKRHYEQEGGDVPGSSLPDVDQKMDKVYGDNVHQNPGTHLSGGIANDALWQERWQQLVSIFLPLSCL
jgi:hypothetical protein